MKPTYQTRHGHVNGNCLEACLASILEVDINTFPTTSNDNWLEEMNNHLIEAHGLFIHTFSCNEPEIFIKGYHLVFAQHRERKLAHAMVGLNGKVFFNPDGGKHAAYNDLEYGVLAKYFN